MLLWGVATAGIGAARTYQQLVVLRTFIGIFESGLTPGIAFLFSCWYTPHELGKRASLFLTSAQIGGLFGGLIAGGLMANLEGARNIRGWQWLFIVEGAVTIAAALAAFFVLPDYPVSCRRLTNDERYIATTRLRRVGTNVDGGSESASRLGLWPTIAGALKNWKTYALSIAAVVSSSSLVLWMKQANASLCISCLVLQPS
jgi:MFS family permease